MQPLAGRSSGRDPREYEDSQIDKEFNVRIPVKAGPAPGDGDLSEEGPPLLETPRQPYPVAFNMDRHPRQFSRRSIR